MTNWSKPKTDMCWHLKDATCEMICATNLMQQLRFISQTLAQHVSGTIVPIFRSARPYITAHGFQYLMCWLESWEAGRQFACTV